ncbi:MAG: DUF1573 domain-containing protein [Bacteroidota bacterium]
MKKAIVILGILALAAISPAIAQTPAAAPAAKETADPAKVLKFEKLTHDFGDIPRNIPATANFEFKNISNKPVVLQNVAAGCGCTVPAWNKEPIAPKKSDKVGATYNAANPGQFTKVVTVTTDAGAVYTLTIKGNVVEKKADEAAPAAK